MQSGHQSSSKHGTKLKQIGINAHLLSGEAGYRRAGIHQYIYQVLRHLPWEEDELAYTIYTQLNTAFDDQPGVAAVPSSWPTGRRLVRIIWEQTVWPWTAWRTGSDLLHSMAFVTPLAASCPAIVTVYDLSFMHFPDRFPMAQRLYLTTMTRLACRRARRLIAISESSRQDIHAFFGVPLSRIDVVLPGVDAVYRPLSTAEVKAFRQQKGIGSFFLHVGTLQPRKNIPVLLRAFAKLPDAETKLVLVGGKGWLYDEIFAQVQALHLTERVIFTGYVPDEELPLWYNAALALVFPSVYEGFGMPVVEAMACGTPVIAADCSSIPEAAGNAGLLFAPDDEARLLAHLMAVSTQPSQREQMRAAGLAHVRQFSWKRAGEETAAVYHRALKSA